MIKKETRYENVFENRPEFQPVSTKKTNDENWEGSEESKRKFSNIERAFSYESLHMDGRKVTIDFRIIIDIQI